MSSYRFYAVIIGFSVNYAAYFAEIYRSGIQGCVQWDGTHVAISMIMLSLLCTIFFIPAMPGVGKDAFGGKKRK